MSKLTDRVSYLKGMAAGMKLNMEKDANKLMLEMLTLMGEMAEEMQQMAEKHTDLNDYVESIDDDLADLEETLFGDEEELSDEEGEEGEEDEFEFSDEDDVDEEEADEADDELISYACPNCEHVIEFRASDVDFDEDFLCPACGKPVFPELEEDE